MVGFFSRLGSLKPVIVLISGCVTRFLFWTGLKVESGATQQVGVHTLWLATICSQIFLYSPLTRPQRPPICAHTVWYSGNSSGIAFKNSCRHRLPVQTMPVVSSVSRALCSHGQPCGDGFHDRQLPRTHAPTHPRWPGCTHIHFAGHSGLVNKRTSSISERANLVDAPLPNHPGLPKAWL